MVRKNERRAETFKRKRSWKQKKEKKKRNGWKGERSQRRGLWVGLSFVRKQKRKVGKSLALRGSLLSGRKEKKERDSSSSIF